MSIQQLITPSPVDPDFKALYSIEVKDMKVDGTLTASSFTPTTFAIDEKSAAAVPIPSAGKEILFANSDQNNNASLKISSGAVVSIGSSLSRFIVDNDPAANAKYTTIQAAINDAKLVPTPSTILICPGTYNEDLILEAGCNLLGVSQINIINNAVTINGSLKANTAIGEVTITNIRIVSDSKDGVSSANGSGNQVWNFSDCNFITTTSGACVSCDNVLCTMIFHNCFFTHCPTQYINITECKTVIFFSCKIGVLGDPGSAFLNTTAGPIVFLGTATVTPITIGATATVIGLFNLFIPADNPAFTLTAGSFLLIAQNTFISDTTSGTEFISGTGTVGNALSVLGGRNTVGAGIVLAPFFTVM